MSFNVQSFRSQMVLDGARPNLFECTLTFPSASVGDGIAVATKYTFMARAAQLPGSTVNQVPVNYFGRELKFAGNRTFPEWTVTIINDEDFIVRKAFEKWMSGMNSHVGNRRLPQFAKGDGGYQQDGSVFQFGKTGDIIKAYKFVGMFPIDLSPIDLDWGANDAIEEYSVTFAYQWWESTRDAVTDGYSVPPPIQRSV
jgi:hypothetical protein